MAGRSKSHMGYEGPEPSLHHKAKHDRQMDAIDAHHAARNRSEGHHVAEGETTAIAGGSMKMNAEGGKSIKGAGLANDHGKNEMQTFKKVAGGRPDVARGKNVA